MSSTTQLQVLLRFLSQDAKVPLAAAMAKVKELQKESLTDPSAISKADLPSLQKIFPDEKLAKQVLNAAKRVSKKRTSSDKDTPSSSSPTSKRSRQTSFYDAAQPSPASIESSLALPTTDFPESELLSSILLTNRAPVVLAFATTLLKYTMPNQPLSSRLSLAQAVVSLNSRSKAVSIGLEGGASAEEEGWGAGQPVVKVMGRSVRVLKRWGYDWNDETGVEKEKGKVEDSQATVQGDEGNGPAVTEQEQEPALWGLDLEALRSSNGPLTAGAHSTGSSLPIYTAQSARAYLLKSFSSPPQDAANGSGSPPKKKTAAALTAEKQHNAAMVLKALDMLFESWAETLGVDELDRRAWSWYVTVRPEVRRGVEGWGERSELRLGDILRLRRVP